MTRRPSKPVLLALVALEVASATLAWRDMSQRPADGVRGDKRLWRTLILLNPGNSLMYWAVGRR
jgi:hypothetical protein